MISGVAINVPTQAQLASAALSGHWKLAVVVDSYSGPPPPATNVFPPGHRGTDSVVLVWQCPTAGACTLQIWSDAGPDPSKASFYSFYSSATSLEGPPVSTPMTQSGASYSQSIPIGGFGGFQCSPSRTVPKPEQRLTITVTDAKQASGGWTATALSGTETLLSGWGCSGGAFSGWTVEHLRITGSPA